MTPEIMNLWLKALGGTRFILAVGNGLVCAFLLVGGYLDGNQFVTIVLATTAVYIGTEAHRRVEAKKVDGAQAG